MEISDLKPVCFLHYSHVIYDQPKHSLIVMSHWVLDDGKLPKRIILQGKKWNFEYVFDYRNIIGAQFVYHMTVCEDAAKDIKDCVRKNKLLTMPLVVE